MALAKFHKKKTLTKPEEFVGSALVEIENTNNDLKTYLKSVILTGVEEHTITKANKKQKTALLVYVHFQSYKVVQAIARKLIIELEKKLKQNVFFTAKRTIESKWVKEHKSQQRPRSRCLTYVYDALLDDLLLPSVIIGKRVRVRLDGTQFTRVHLDQNDRDYLEEKLDLVTAIYKKLTTREVTFEFREDKTFHTYKK
ncbi:s7e ribosomal protein, putative [Ichthyophthirius multifiliis]|uniref:40S ribosomal protein S7 n=1 Tax=Ichthyophthirius multifiliis TaxID=5932 RepID=G0R1Y7_ICHMU|nr:s7e ribosomal protein, putative [Ichthyophthirius multifiliis]EGR28512.1 s7e ribosomal protein, putative [Ichthyophthirius multifiliis]|eukprot:XP_004029748.1 s7e ribosomal protein, putative [Ichthyophthirius multifiliis]